MFHYLISRIKLSETSAKDHDHLDHFCIKLIDWAELALVEVAMGKP